MTDASVDSMFSPPQERNSGMFSFDYGSYLGGSEAMEEDAPYQPSYLPQKTYDDRKQSTFIKQEPKHSRDSYTAPSFLSKTTSAKPLSSSTKQPNPKKRTLDPTDLQTQPLHHESVKMPQFNILDEPGFLPVQPSCLIKTEKPSFEPVPQPATVEVVVERQPPVEVRTRTPSENRYVSDYLLGFKFSHALLAETLGLLSELLAITNT